MNARSQANQVCVARRIRYHHGLRDSLRPALRHVNRVKSLLRGHDVDRGGAVANREQGLFFFVSFVAALVALALA